MLELLSFLEHRPQSEIHQVPQDHCSDRNPELSHFNANLLRLVALRPRPTADMQPIAPAAEILPQLFPVSESRPANVSRTETMPLPPHTTLTFSINILRLDSSNI